MGSWNALDKVAIADCALEIRGDDLDDLFATAARALADVMVDPATVSRDVDRTVRLEARALDLLLHDWLSELISLKDSEQLVFPEVAAATPSPASGVSLFGDAATSPRPAESSAWPTRFTRARQIPCVPSNRLVMSRRAPSEAPVPPSEPGAVR